MMCKKKEVTKIFDNIVNFDGIKDKQYYVSRNRNNFFSLPLELVYITLPYKKVVTTSWTRSVNDLQLSITSGINEETKQPYGIPFGVVARRLMYFTCTEAVRKKTQTILLGNSYNDAFTNLCISKSRPDGRTINRFKDQVLRLFFSRISLWGNKKNNTQEYNIKQALNLAKGTEFFKKDDKFNFAITLTNDFYEYIINSRLIPFDYEIINCLDSTPMLMDLYIFLNYKAYSANLTDNNIFISYQELFDAFGTFSTYKHFKINIKNNLKKLLKFHKGLVLEDTKVNNLEGLLISKFSVSNVDTKQPDLFASSYWKEDNE